MTIQRIVLIFVFFFSGLTHPVWAYLGPGTGLSALGTILAAIVGVIVAIFGFFWYPIKRLLRKKNKRSADPVEKADQ